jgi:hypothetical protein
MAAPEECDKREHGRAGDIRVIETEGPTTAGLSR